ncbi:MAG: hypothetical protein M1828_006910 [Chrysothrix sp. TS-e1954]|nr:MAG: hypothetical protein M1828_006910 [Chrysothrix sp. TS-e1954]
MPHFVAAHGSIRLNTEILPVRTSLFRKTDLGDWVLDCHTTSIDHRNLQRAAHEIVSTDVPVAFPTETVYGLGADATRSEAVQGIYRAKQRPSDNPLIVHIHSLSQLRQILQPSTDFTSSEEADGHSNEFDRDRDDGQLSAAHFEGGADPIPSIYHSLIKRFWPGPLTLILPNPLDSRLAQEVTAGLQTFGARMPRNPHALALIRSAGVPLAAPSANASGKPSPTTAQHVLHDLQGRITTIIDGGPCQVGLESTVVDGLCDPPVILRPGGVGIEEIRQCPGWQKVLVGYKNVSETTSNPRAPGMKYRHYSPKAPVLLAEYPGMLPTKADIAKCCGRIERLGIVRTNQWRMNDFEAVFTTSTSKHALEQAESKQYIQARGPRIDGNFPITVIPIEASADNDHLTIIDIGLGSDAETVARGLFSALRELDVNGVDAIVVEGIDESQGDLGAAVMNRLRKAAIPFK